MTPFLDKLRIERLTEGHYYRKFRCGEHTLDSYLKRHALDNDRRGLGSTYVASYEEPGRVAGYITICASAISFEHVPEEQLPRYPIPALLIARLAVDRLAQGRGIGGALMLHALELADEVADLIGVYAVTVEAINEGAKRYYRERFGFSELLDSPLHLYMTVADIRASGLGTGSQRGHPQT